MIPNKIVIVFMIKNFQVKVKSIECNYTFIDFFNYIFAVKNVLMILNQI